MCETVVIYNYIYMDYVEKKILFELQKASNDLVNIYKRVLNNYELSGSEKELFESELARAKNLRNLLSQSLQSQSEVDRDHVKAMLKSENRSEQVLTELEKKETGGDKPVGSKDIQKVKGMETVTQLYLEHEKTEERIQQNRDNKQRGTTRLETENAKYVITYQRHDKEAKINSSTYEEVNCLVFENAVHPDKVTPKSFLSNREVSESAWKSKIPFLESKSLEQKNPFNTITAYNIQRDLKPVFVADAPFSGQSSGSQFDKENTLKKAVSETAQGVSPDLLASIAAWVGFYSVNSLTGFGSTSILLLLLIAQRFAGSEGKRKWINKGLRPTQVIDPNVVRGVIAADKLESVVAPYMREKTGEKPCIYLNYGAAHTEIETCLEHPKFREKVLKLNSKLGFPLLMSEELQKTPVFEFGQNEYNYLETVYDGKKTSTRYSKELLNYDKNK